MNVLLVGATGLIGSAVASHLLGRGHRVLGVTRTLDAAARRVPLSGWIEMDLRDVGSADDWGKHLESIDAVVNCAGALQDSARDSVEAVHLTAPRHLWEACRRAGVRRIVQISAAGVDRDPETEFMRTKLAGDATLAGSGLDWTILRPTLVVGRAAYGGSALLRALASLPVTTRLPGAGAYDTVEVDDVARTVVWSLEDPAAIHATLELAGPERMRFEDLVASYRAWLGYRPAFVAPVPPSLAMLGFRLGDIVSLLGWRPPMRMTAWREAMRGTTGDGMEWRRATGIRPRTFDQALAADPPSVQDRWFARLYLLKPLALAAFVLFWLLTAAIAAGPGWGQSVARMASAGIPHAPVAVALGIVADLAVGILISCRSTARIGLRLALAVTLGYAAVGTMTEPALWIDPLGPLVKLLPCVALNLVLLAILEER